MGYTVSADSGLLNLGAANASAGLQGIVDAYKNKNSAANLQRNALQQALIDKQNTAEQDMYSKINTLPGTPHSTLDSNIKNFFMNEIDYGYDIKSLVQNGQMNNREANAILAKLNSDMDTYTALAPQIMAQAEIMKAAIADGSISRANADPMQMMFMGIANNAGDIHLDRGDDGNMYLNGSGTIDGEAWEGKVNIKEIQQYLSTEGNQIARTIPTSEEMGLGATFEELKTKGKLNAYMKTTFVDDPDNPGYQRQKQEFTPELVEKLRADLMENPGLFEELMKSETGISAWSDVANSNINAEELNGTIGTTMIVDGEEVPNPLAGKQDWGKWDINNVDKKDYMKGKLIDRMLAENLPTALLGKLEVDKIALERMKARYASKGSLSAGDKKAASYLGFVNEAFKANDISALNKIQKGTTFAKDTKTGNWVATTTKVENGVTIPQETILGKINFKDKNSYLDVLNVLGITGNLYALNEAGFQAFDGSPLNPDELAGARSEVVEYSNILGGHKGGEGLGFKIDQAKDKGKSIDDILKIKGMGDQNNISLTTLFKNNGVTIKPGSWNKNKKYIKIGEGSNIFNTKLDGLELTMENLDKLLHFIDQGAIAQGRSDRDEDKMTHDNILINRGR